MIIYQVKNLFHQRNLKQIYQATVRQFTTKKENDPWKLQQELKKTMDSNDTIYLGKVDRYNGITVDTNIEKISSRETFTDILKNSLDHWTKDDRRTIWFKVALNDAAYVPILAENGFNFHHARNDFVMMVKWLPKTETPNLPMYAHTMIGVGGLVTNSKNQILAIREKHSIIPGMWKLPGGYVEPNENFDDAVIREVFEETGIKTKYETLLSVRHSRGFNFGCSDMYIVIALKPITDDNNDSSEEITICVREIAESKWMNFNEFLEHPNVHDLNRELLRTYLDYKKRDLKIFCKRTVHPQFKKTYDLYFAEPKL